MSTLIRNDGAVFLIQVYRDQLSSQKPKRMREAVRHLSAQQGRYVRVLTDKKGRAEVCLDKNVGFLLGESIARHFKEHANFIYIENKEKLGKSIVVVVRKGRVQLDALLAADDIWSEVMPLVAGDIAYDVFYAGFNGQLPANDSAKELLARSVPLPHALLDRLPLDLDLQLVPCEQALQESSFSGISRGLWATTVGVLLAIVVIVVAVGRAEKVRQPEEPWVPYASYYAGITQEPASKVLASVINVLSQVFSLPAIQLHRLEYRNHQLELDFISHHAKLSPLLTWAKQNQFHFALRSSNVTLTRQLQFQPVSSPDKIYSATQLYVYLSDHLRSIHPGSSFRLSSRKPDKHWKVLTCEWQVKGLTAADLDWLRRLLVNAPVSCDGISLAYHGGVMQGTIHLKIWGT